MTLLLIFAGLALGVSFLCSLLESVLLSVTPSFIGAKQAEGDPVGDRLFALKEDVDRSLAAILSVNTIANTVGAVGVGAQAQTVFGDGAVAVVSAILTLAILFASEIVPKTVGATHWRFLAPWMARVLPVLILVAYPLVVMARGLMRALSPDQAPPQLSREEMTAMTELGYEEGIVERGESHLLQNVLRFGDLMVNDIMTPRTVLHAFDETMTVEEYMKEDPDSVFSRIPVYRDDVDNITGYVLKNDVLLEVARDRFSSRLEELRRDVPFVPEHQSVRELFEFLVGQQQHIAMVVDEYGGIAGVVSMEDVVETLLGMEIVDESDQEQDMRELARKQWLKRAKRMGIAPEEFDNPANPRTDEIVDKIADELAGEKVDGHVTEDVDEDIDESGAESSEQGGVEKEDRRRD